MPATEIRPPRPDLASLRLQAGRLMLAGTPPGEAARALGISRHTAYAWKARLDAGGLDALRAVTRGRPAQLDDHQLEALRTLLRQRPAEGAPAWTLRTVCDLIEREWGVRFSRVHAWRLLGHLGLRATRPPH